MKVKKKNTKKKKNFYTLPLHKQEIIGKRIIKKSSIIFFLFYNFDFFFISFRKKIMVNTRKKIKNFIYLYTYTLYIYCLLWEIQNHKRL